MRSFGEILRSQRQKLKLTQKQVADTAKVSDAYICSLESDKRPPPPYYTVEKIADALDLDADQLWKVAVRSRAKYAVEKSKRKEILRKGKVPDSHLDVFFEREGVRMMVFGLFKKPPEQLSIEEKRAVYHAINGVQRFMSQQADEAANSS